MRHDPCQPFHALYAGGWGRVLGPVLAAPCCLRPVGRGSAPSISITTRQASLDVTDWLLVPDSVPRSVWALPGVPLRSPSSATFVPGRVTAVGACASVVSTYAWASAHPCLPSAVPDPYPSLRRGRHRPSPEGRLGGADSAAAGLSPAASGHLTWTHPTRMTPSCAWSAPGGRRPR